MAIGATRSGRMAGAIWRPRVLSADRLALALVLAGALAVRFYVIATHTYVIHPDETFQYFEPAHRLVFGTGVVPWEYIDGIRSWLLPGVIAGVMWVANWIDPGGLLYLPLTRGLMALASLLPVAAAFHWTRRVAGLGFAIAAASFVAISYDLVFFAPVVLTEMLASYVALAAIWLGDVPAGDRNAGGRRFASGMCYGLACCLRFQYGPALVLAALWQCRTRWACWRWLLAGGLIVVLPVAGVLDWLTLGAPFQSIWLNVERNVISDVASAMGTAPVMTYAAVILYAWTATGLMLAVLGVRRVPALALVAIGVLIEHSLVAHKEYRFIFLTLMALPILIALGLATLVSWMGPRAPRFTRGAAFVVMAVLLGLSWHQMLGITAFWWQEQQPTIGFFEAAHARRDLCGLAVDGVVWERSGGYTYLNRDVPLYLGDYAAATRLPGSTALLRLRVMRHGHEVPQYPGALLASHSAAYNEIIAAAGNAPPGYVPLMCGADTSDFDPATICLYHRPGPCR